MNARVSPNSALVTWHPDDLIDDRELRAASDDELDHAGIVDQLAALSTNVAAPANIALYGPWGSGKSGISNLLKAKIDNTGGVRFVRFDAFKYANVPLRRTFISALATELDCKNNAYHRDLYSGKTQTEIKVPPTTLLKVVGFFGVLLLALIVTIGLVVAGAAWVASMGGEQQGDFGGEFRSLAGEVLMAGLLPASLLAALVALASKTFSVDRSLAKPESDEEFENLFRALVKDSGANRLVVFVDELDRCSADEVVVTLDTIRTFLGIDKCVFIVAADQNVLEQALTSAARQETPADEANPYYSTGSAYLDKVFQYQIGIPPLLTQSVSNYATTLVGNRGGVWAEINQGHVLSVLIPTHVTSPRRVKHLLNTFALTYRLAEERHRAELLAEDPKSSAASLARLVCLRVEFPLFARHLELDANLPSLVLEKVSNAGADISSPSERAKELALQYAKGDVSPGTLLADDKTDGDNDDDGEGRGERTAKAHTKQLLNYLQRTRTVRGPSRDLVYMQSTGTSFGLDGAVARAIELAAEDNDVDAIRKQLEGADEATWAGAIRLLEHQVAVGSGLIAANSARSFLLLIEGAPTHQSIGAVADSIADRINFMEDDADDDWVVLDGDTLPSAWRLAELASSAPGYALRRLVIGAVSRNEPFPDFLLRDMSVALTVNSSTVADDLSARIVSHQNDDLIPRLFKLEDEVIVHALGAMRSNVADLFMGALNEYREWKQGQEESAAAATTPATTRTAVSASETSSTTDESPEPFDPRPVLHAIAEAAKPKETLVQHEVVGLLLSVDDVDARQGAVDVIRKTEPVSDPILAMSILTSAVRRVLSDVPAWLAGVVPSAITNEHAKPIADLLMKAWEWTKDSGTVTTALGALAPLRRALPSDNRPDLTDHVLELVESHVENSDEAEARTQILERAKEFGDAGMLDVVSVRRKVASTLRDTLTEELSEVDQDDALYLYVAGPAVEALRETAPELPDQMLLELLQAAQASDWLDQLGRAVVPLAFAEAIGVYRIAAGGLPSMDDMVELIHQYEESAAPAVVLWMEITQPDPAALKAVYEALLGVGGLTNEIAVASEAARADWSAGQRRDFLSPFVADATHDVPKDLHLRALGLDTAVDRDVADILCTRFGAVTNNNQRQNIVTLWKKADLQDTGARRQLFETVIYGLLDLHAMGSTNAGAVEIALDALQSLGSPVPHGTKGELLARVEAAVDGQRDLSKTAVTVMTGLGYKVSRKHFRKKKMNVVDDESDSG